MDNETLKKTISDMEKQIAEQQKIIDRLKKVKATDSCIPEAIQLSKMPNRKYVNITYSGSSSFENKCPASEIW